MSCPRFGENCFEYACGFSDKGVCTYFDEVKTPSGEKMTVENCEKDRVFMEKLLDIAEMCTKSKTTKCTISFDYLGYKIKCDMEFDAERL